MATKTTRKIFVTRPHRDAMVTCQHLNDRSISCLCSPIITIDLSPKPTHLPDSVQALIITSANGLHAFVDHYPGKRDWPVLAVGKTSAAVARAYGFPNIMAANGDVASLVELIKNQLDPRAGILYHPAATHGKQDTQYLLKAAGFTYHKDILYTAKAVADLPTDLAHHLQDGTVEGGLFFSARSADIFHQLIRRADLADCCRSLVAFSLSPSIARQCQQLPWGSIVTAPHPQGDIFLDLVEATLNSVIKN